MMQHEARDLPLHTTVKLSNGQTGAIIGYYLNSGAVVVQIKPGDVVILPCVRLMAGTGREVRECRPSV